VGRSKALGKHRETVIANYGFKNGSGDWYVAIDTDKCNGCGKCVEVCPAHVLEIAGNEYDPFEEEQVARVVIEERKKIRYTCAPCKPGYGVAPSPCVTACELEAIFHSDGWKRFYRQE
jgi:ferredoxin